MSEELFETSNVRWGDLVGNGRRLIVPPFQRDYAWDQDNWEDLWSDLLELHSPSGEKSSSTHYMGSIVIQQISDRRFYVIDGQQRLTTLSLVALAGVERLRELAAKGVDQEHNLERAELLQDRFLGSKDPTTLIYDWKLQLNRHCNDFYQHYLMSRHPITDSKLSSASKLLSQAYQFFCARIRDNNSISDDGMRISEFLNNTVAMKTVFIQVKVQNDVNAYMVFETLNARGVELTPTDLIKNYLFSMLTPVEKDVTYLEAHWQNIGTRVGFSNLPEFMRHYVNSTRKLIRGDRIFREIKDEIKSSDQVVEFLRRLERESEVYEDLQNPDSNAWRDVTGAKAALQFLNLISIKQVLPVLLATVRKTKKERWTAIFNALGIFMLRYSTICGQRNRPIEPLLSKLAVAIHNGQIDNQRGVQKSLASLYPDDSTFETAFSKWSASLSGSNKRLVRYLMGKLDSLSAQEHLTIEHIGPQKDSDGNQWCSRLGNYALIEADLNKTARGVEFSRKVAYYKKSSVPSTKSLEGSQWSEAQVNERQAELAKKAIRLWRFSEGLCGMPTGNEG